ncbi:Complex 1 protein (LYR family) [Geosmithia morbida]|uniref:Complex 1 protein (LYR family) n=1 Tax=Geosmithia morbida TaxID=1094350 RepID=A0A9P4Z0D6_9HYPO|nr:Complex 1 protein (LYR family) [Geosmithia morbida]KAF4124334.1 Complex 1 protein (LYR family) [Geosmithia morbida]
MSTSAPRLRSLYRSLLRELPPRPVLSLPRAPVHGRLRDSFAASPGSDSATSKSADSTTARRPPAHVEAARAHQLATYLRSQRSYVNLIERYNPGINMEDEDRIRLTARRVGMDMPEEYKK